MKLFFKQYIKYLFIAIALILIIYVLFIIEESIRLYNNKLSDPLIVIEEKHNYDSTIYKSVGFSITTKYFCRSSDLCFVNGQEFWLFNEFLIWGWID